MDPAQNGMTGDGGEFARRVTDALNKIRPALQAVKRRAWQRVSLTACLENQVSWYLGRY